jgi:hypothetical protein
METEKETPLPIKPASTVVLVREQERELLVYLVTLHELQFKRSLCNPGTPTMENGQAKEVPAGEPWLNQGIW